MIWFLIETGMNAKDEKQMLDILGAFETRGFKGVIIFDVPSTQFVRVNLMMLRGLSQERGLPGVFISVDRPHQYMVHLLSMHQIKAENLVYIDAISRFSADFKIANANVGFMDGPFHIDRLPIAMNEWIKGCNGQSLNLNNSGFAIIDNLSALLTYNSFNSVQTFLQNFIQALHSSGNMIVPLMMDSEKSGLLYETARSMCKVEIRLKDILSDELPKVGTKIEINCTKE
jgi:hypothetical protein